MCPQDSFLADYRQSGSCTILGKRRVGDDRLGTWGSGHRRECRIAKPSKSPFYSARRELIGSTCVARRAGRYMPAKETTTNKAAAIPNADVSRLRKGNGEL